MTTELETYKTETQRRAEMVQGLAKALALDLGWQYDEPKSDYSTADLWGSISKGDYKINIRVRWNLRGTEGRANIFCKYPHVANAFFLPKDYKLPDEQITVNITRKITDLIKDIRRRVIPVYINNYGILKEKANVHMGLAGKQNDHARQVNALLEHGGSSMSDSDIYGHIGDVYIKGKANYGGSVDLDINSLKVDQAIIIVQLIKSMKAQEESKQ